MKANAEYIQSIYKFLFRDLQIGNRGIFMYSNWEPRNVYVFKLGAEIDVLATKGEVENHYNNYDLYSGRGPFGC